MNHSEVSAISSEFRQEMARVGIVTQSEFIADGRLHRFHVEGDKPGRKNGWYALHLEPYAVGTFGAWNRGDGHHTWRRSLPKGLSGAERTALEKACAEARAKQAAEIQARQAKARLRAEYVWNRCKAPAPANHAYLLKKQIKPNGAKHYKGCLLLPVHDVEGTLHNLQFITSSGSKNFLRGGRVSGCCYGFGRPGLRIYVTEGFATGATVHEATGEAVVIAFNAGNLKPVAQALRKRYPKVEIVIAADNDARKDENIGLARAKEAALAVKGKLVIPRFPDTATEPTDFNDLFRLEGAEAVKRQLEGATGRELLRRFEAQFNRYIIAPKGTALIGGLYAMMTHCFEIFGWIGYLAFVSPLESCGKSRSADIVGWASARPEILVSITQAALFRLITESKPTVVVDEAEVLCGDDETAVALRAVLHAGCAPDDGIIRCAPNTHKLERFSPWSPKVFCMIGEIPHVLRSRCIVIPMERKKASQKTASFIRRRVKPEQNQLGAEFAAWIEAYKSEIQRAYESLPDSSFEGRSAENFAPLEAILSVAAPERLPELGEARTLASGEPVINPDGDGIYVLLLTHIRHILGKARVKELPSAKLCDKLAALEDGPWGTWTHGKPVTPDPCETLPITGPVPHQAGSDRREEITVAGLQVSAVLECV